ncbi:hypothetical protein HELRODRAFT_182046 [Helobdella robusta]|uniref:WSC domain-containing protein n=1 Tax=Helobdella robusta TaxID=6412 RepID=T1FHN0_HELRO|nr:hypothetical protein HELRODRAFT_182046 [Helobdella robusta]ESN91868.1 hypothetical protein HELRODRAFT_182046 [Helobdella robusta]
MTSHNNMERIFFLIICYLVSVLSFAPLGCYMTTPSDKNDMRQGMAASDMTVLQCVTKCRQDGKAYAGLLVQTNCWCGEEFGRTSAMTGEGETWGIIRGSGGSIRGQLWVYWAGGRCEL